MAPAASKARQRHQQVEQEVDGVEEGHGAHICEEVLRLKSERLEIDAQWFSLLNLKQRVDRVAEIKKVKRGDRHQLLEEDLCIAGHADLKEWKHDDELLGVDHGPESVQRGRDQYIDDEVRSNYDLRALKQSRDSCLDRFFVTAEL